MKYFVRWNGVEEPETYGTLKEVTDEIENAFAATGENDVEEIWSEDAKGNFVTEFGIKWTATLEKI